MPVVKVMTIFSGVSGAASGDLIRPHMSSGGVWSGSSRMPASYEQCMAFSSAAVTLSVL